MKPEPIAADPSPLLTAQELAEKLQVTVAHVHRLAKRGVINRYRIGHRTHRYDLDEVLAALRERETPSVTPSRGAATSRKASAPPLSTLPTFDWSSRS